MPARVWTENIRQEYEDYEGKVVSVKGKINFYAGHPELSVELMRPLNDGEFLVDEVCRTLDEETVKNDTESIRTMMKKVGDDGLRGFVGKILNSENLDKMDVLPVHISGHHNYRGGMLEHTMEVAFGAYFHAKTTAAVRRQPVDYDILITGALLHDLVTLFQVRSRGYGFYRAPFDGLLNGSQAYEILSDARKEFRISDEAFAHLIHIIDASHEGAEAKTLEAMAVKSANALSIEMNRLEDTFRNTDLYNRGGALNTYSRTLGREVYRFGRKDEA